MAAKYFLTTPIFYVNSVPHIGHLYTAVLADAIARWQHICGKTVTFSAGTDEHGLKIQQAAANAKQLPQEFCTRISAEFKRLFSVANVKYSDYIRTTEQRHREAVEHFWNVLLKNGHIYKGSYEGWYSVPDEAFLTPEQVTKHTSTDGKDTMVSLESGHTVEWIKEDNYMFRLSAFSDQLSSWLSQKVIHPAIMETSLKPFISNGLSDLSVSRNRSRLQWGIPVPGDETQTIYVWLDALTNYLTVAGYPHSGFQWPIDCLIVGKDILRFHAIYWSAMLMAAGLQPPRSILCHSHWTVDNAKMSKSKGNVVDPFDQMQKFSTDGLRYFLLKEGVPHFDGNYSESKVIDCVNSDLVNTLGNLLNRVTGTVINPSQSLPPFDRQVFDRHGMPVDRTMLQTLSSLPKKVNEHYTNFHIYRGLDAIMTQLHATNGFIQRHQPWKLAKSKSDSDIAWLNSIVAVALETLRITGILLQPVTPLLTDKLLQRLGVSPNERAFEHASMSCLDTHDGTHKHLGQLTGVLVARLEGK